MSEEDLDLSEFDSNLVEHFLVGAARYRMMEEIVEGKSWNLDLNNGTLTLDEVEYQVQALGSYSELSDTFLWSWANSEASDWSKSLVIANTLRELGNKPGYAVFRESKISPEWVTKEEIAFVSGELSGGHPLFVGSYDGGAVYLLITNLKIDVLQLPIIYIPGIFMQLPLTLGDSKPAVLRFLERLQFNVTEKKSSLIAIREDAKITVQFTKNGGIKKTEVDARCKA